VHKSPGSAVVKSCFGISQYSISSTEIKASLMEIKDHVVKCSLRIGDMLIHPPTLFDCGATGIVFLDTDIVCHDDLERKKVR
jgi:hypothetical protein